VFDARLERCQTHGFADVEASNRFMRATACIYLGQTDWALSDALDSAALGQRVGNRRAEVVSRLTASWVLTALGRAGEAREQIEAGLEIVQALQAARFEPFLLDALARVSLLEGRDRQAEQQIARAWDLVEQRKLQPFIGPWVLGTVALISREEGARQAALARGRRC
jgi:ATP/maltotriose-dependent transcriptional regulator MalT